MMGKKILIAEDDKVLRDVLMEKLAQVGYETNAVEDGEAAMEALTSNTPDLVLLDILMPKKNGMEVMEAMRNNDALKRVPIIVISNSGQPVEIKRAKELGARDFLVKAVFDPNEVLDKVAAVFQRSVDTGGNDDDEDDAAIEIHTDVPQAPSEAAAEGGEQTKVLVVEDDDFLRGLFDRKLMARGLSVNSAMNAGEAFDSLEKRLPHIIMLDLMLPGIDGFDILATLKKDQRFKDIPVIIISNLGQKKDIDKAFELGAADFLVKSSLTLDEIINRVLSVIDKKGDS